MAGTESHEFRFQCPNCGHDLRQTIGRLKANERLTCAGCNVGINIDAGGSADHLAEIARSMNGGYTADRRQVLSLSVGHSVGVGS